jgi:hypothetical protein
MALCNAMDKEPERLHYIGFHSRKTLRRQHRDFLPKAVPITMAGLRLAPLYFWYDKPHVARVDHYRHFVFGQGRFKVGDFIEDTLGHAMLEDIRVQGVNAHASYGTWNLICDEAGLRPTLRHFSGRHYRENLYMRSRKEKSIRPPTQQLVLLDI